MIWIRIRIKINSIIMIMIIIRRPSGEEGASAFRLCLLMIGLLRRVQAEARHTERKYKFSRRRRATRRGNADLAGGSKMQQAETRHTERKYRYSRRKQDTRRRNADLAGGSKAHGEDMQI